MTHEYLPTCRRAIAYCREHPRGVIVSFLCLILLLSVLAGGLLLWIGRKFEGLGDPVSLMH